MPARFLPFLLSFFLLCGQMGGFVHELSHWHDDLPDAAQQVPDSPDDPLHDKGRVCQLCVAYAAMVTAMPSATAAPPPQPASAAWLRMAAPAMVHPAPAAHYKSRAPPVFSV